jgi:hypothetical protein
MVNSDRRRLHAAFKELQKLGYTAKANNMCCQTCGWAEIPDNAQKVVFYHRQDAYSFDKHGNLTDPICLAWSGNAKEIVSTINKHDLRAKWCGKDDRRIEVRGLKR